MKDVPPNVSGLKRVELGLENTYWILERIETQEPVLRLMENLDLLSSLDIIKWIPFRRITELI